MITNGIRAIRQNVVIVAIEIRYVVDILIFTRFNARESVGCDVVFALWHVGNFLHTLWTVVRRPSSKKLDGGCAMFDFLLDDRESNDYNLQFSSVVS